MEEDLTRRMADEAAASKARQVKLAEAVAASKRQAEVARVVSQYGDLISAKVRGNIRLPDNLTVNPQVRCLVKLLPTGEVTDVKPIKSGQRSATTRRWNARSRNLPPCRCRANATRAPHSSRNFSTAIAPKSESGAGLQAGYGNRPAMPAMLDLTVNQAFLIRIPDPMLRAVLLLPLFCLALLSASFSARATLEIQGFGGAANQIAVAMVPFQRHRVSQAA
jgi:hypothetical protein